MAVEYINRDTSILGDYQLDLLVEDTECKVDVTMKHFLHYAVDGEHTVAGILGKYLKFLVCNVIFGICKLFTLSLWQSIFNSDICRSATAAELYVYVYIYIYTHTHTDIRRFSRPGLSDRVGHTKIYIQVHVLWYFSLQCFDTVGWATGRASGL